MPTHPSLCRALCLSLPALGLLSLSSLAMAQALPATPSAGSLLRQMQPDAPLATPQPDNVLPVHPAPSNRAVSSSDGSPQFTVHGFRLDGIDAALAKSLKAVLAPFNDRRSTLGDLERAAKDVEVALQRRGFFLAQVCVPQQRLSDGIVTLQVYPGRLGEVKLDIGPDVKVDPNFIDRIVAPLRAHPVVESGLVERVLFTLGDLRGIDITSSLSPGQEPGVADLTVRVRATAQSGVTTEFDNSGSVYTGRDRVYSNFDVYGLLGRGDIFNLKTQFSYGSYYLRPSWLVPVNAQGTKIGLSGSYLSYDLGTSLFRPLNATGDARTFGLMALHPLVRSRNDNVFVQASVETRRFEDSVGAIDLVTNKGVTDYLNLGVAGDFRDAMAGGGISNYLVQWVHGRLRYDAPGESLVDAMTYQASGAYDKLVISGSRLQSLPNRDELYLAVQGQLASRNLDSSEKFNAGGLYGDRGYPAGEAPSDEGAMLTWEYRKPIGIRWVPGWAPAGDYVFSVFGDYAATRLHNAAIADDDTPNRRYLRSHGIGLTYGGDHKTLIRAQIAVRGSEAAQADDSKVRFLLQASRSF
jgi:hemolysin activation/secretion protein